MHRYGNKKNFFSFSKDEREEKRNAEFVALFGKLKAESYADLVTVELEPGRTHAKMAFVVSLWLLLVGSVYSFWAWRNFKPLARQFELRSDECGYAAAFWPTDEPCSGSARVHGCQRQATRLLASVLQALASMPVTRLQANKTDHVVVMNLVDFLCQVLCRLPCFAVAEVGSRLSQFDRNL